MATETGFPLRLRDGVRLTRRGNYYIDERWAPVGVTEQFTDDAETYHERRRLDFQGIMDRCLTLANIDRNAALTTLDIGSGSGGSVFATAYLLPKATVVASDISTQLLDMLARGVAADPVLRNAVTVCCFDLHAPFFAEDQFDFVVGSAILHHLIDPLAALTNVAPSIKPGGKLVLIEPLEAGCKILTIIYANVIKALQQMRHEDQTLVKLMHALRADLHHRLEVPRQWAWTANLDDKWVFDEPYLMQLQSDLGFSGVDIYPVQDDVSNVFESAFRSLMIETGNTGLEVPEAVIDAFREFDRNMSEDLKRQLSPTGIIVFSK